MVGHVDDIVYNVDAARAENVSVVPGPIVGVRPRSRRRPSPLAAVWASSAVWAAWS